MILVEKDIGFGKEVKTAEAYFTSPQEFAAKYGNAYDVVFFIQSKLPQTPCPHTPFETSIIDLTKPEEEIFGGFADNTRYEIRRTIKEQEIASLALRQPSDDEILYLCKRYAQLRIDKGMEDDNGESYRFYVNNMRELARQGNYVITFARKGQEEPLCLHSYVFDGERARLHQSVSQFRHADNKHRQLIGRANRYLHWSDIGYFKSLGAKFYDLGGLGGDHPSIAEFKRGFGGIPIHEAHFYYPFTPWGEKICAGLSARA